MLIVLAAAVSACGPGRETFPVAPAPMGRVPLQPVENAKLPPYSSICRLSVTRRRVKSWLYLKPWVATSTGFLIGNGRMLTSGHTFFTTFWTRVVDAEPGCGFNGTPGEWNPAEPFSRTRVRVATDYYWFRFDRDYSMLRLGETPPYRPAFRLAREDEAVLRVGDSIHVAGYASENKNHGNRLYHAHAVITNVDHAQVFHYNVDTQRGMSGGPVWIEKNGEYVIIGVHVGEGMARRVNRTLLQEVQSWTATEAAGG